MTEGLRQRILNCYQLRDTWCWPALPRSAPACPARPFAASRWEWAVARGRVLHLPHRPPSGSLCARAWHPLGSHRPPHWAGPRSIQPAYWGGRAGPCGGGVAAQPYTRPVAPPLRARAWAGGRSSKRGAQLRVCGDPRSGGAGCSEPRGRSWRPRQRRR